MTDRTLELNIDWGTRNITVAYAHYEKGERTSDPFTVMVANRAYEAPAVATWLPDGRFIHGFDLEDQANTDPTTSDKIVTLFKVSLSSQPGASKVKERVETLLAELGKTLDNLIEDHIHATVEHAKDCIKQMETNRGTQVFDEADLDDMLGRVLVRITVPDSWTPDATRRMQKAAKKAGLQHVVVASEAKAAIAFLVHQAAGVAHPLGAAFVKGNVLITADIGCGTGDFVVNQLKDDLSIHSRFETLGHSSGDVCGSFQVDELLLAWLIKSNKPGWAELTAKKLGVTARDFTRRVLEAVSKIKENFDERDEVGLGHIRGIGAHHESFGIPRQVMYDALDTVIVTIVSYIKKQIKTNQQPSAILVTGGFSRSSYLMRKLRETFKGITVIRPSDTDSAQCFPVAVGALLRWENIKDQDLPSKYGYAILQRQYYDDDSEDHKDSWTWDEQSEERIPKPWVKASPYEPDVEIVEDRIKTIIARDEKFKGAKTIEMEFRIPVENPRITAEFVYLTQRFKDSAASQKLSREGPDGYTMMKAVRPWASVDVALSAKELKSHGFEKLVLEDGEEFWVLNVRVIVRKATRTMDIEFEVLKPRPGVPSGKKGIASKAFKGEVAFKVKDTLWDGAFSEFAQ